MNSLLNNLSQLLNRSTVDFLSQRIGVTRSQMIPAIESVVSFLFRLVERADSFNYYELASIFTRNGRDTNTPDKIIEAIKLGHKHEALSDARKLLNVLLHDNRENFESLLSKQHGLTNNQAEQIVFIGAVFTNVLLGHSMITEKMNMRAITRNIKSEAVMLSEKMTIEMKELNRQLTTQNMMIDESKPLRVEPKNNTMLYASLFAGLLILISVLYKACSGTMH